VHLKRSLCPLLVVAALIAAAAPRISFAIQHSGPSQAALDAGDAYLRALGKAANAYASGDLPEALNDLNDADAVHADIPDTWNMRGAIYAEMHEYDKAEDAFQRAAKLNPGDFWPQYNIAQLMLMQKKYGQAAQAFASLEVYKGHEELVQFKIIIADLMDGKSGDAKPVLDGMKFPSDTPAYYFAHAAWSYANQDRKNGNYYVTAGIKVFGPDRCVSFYDTLAGAGWTPQRNADGSVPELSDEPDLLSLPGVTPEPGAIPGTLP
jgi:tetratricopeptide (TPR) repeat protein